MKPIALFFHGLLFMGDPPKLLDNAVLIISEQMEQIAESGLLDACSEFHVGINGGFESRVVAQMVFPEKAKVTYHGLQSKAENLTVCMAHEWAMKHPGWNMLYLHAKGSTHAIGSDYGENVSKPWRRAMMQDLVMDWKRCVADLETHDIATMLWLWNQADGTQHIPAGNLLWITSDFAARLPSMYLRERIKQDGIGAASSRYEAEVYWGNGPRPNVKSYRNRLPF